MIGSVWKKHLGCGVFLMLAVSVMLASGTSMAQSLTGKAAIQADAINRRQSSEWREKEAEELARRSQAPDGGGTPSTSLPETNAGDTCVQVNTIRISGAEVISRSGLDDAVSSWMGRCLGLSELNQILKAVTYEYIKKGYIASRAYLAEQDLSDGSLEVTVVEGKLESVRSSDLLNIGNSELQTAFPGLVGLPVNIRDIEQGLDQINRLSSNDAATSLEAGRETGDSVVVVTNKQSKKWHLSLESNDHGSVSTGLYQTRADLVLDDVLHLNDEWRIGYQRSMSYHPYFFTRNTPNSEAVNASVSIPVGYWTAGLDFNWSDYHSMISGTISQIETSGKAISFSPYASRLLHRDQISKTLLTGRLTWKKNENFLLGSLIDTSSRSLTVAAFDLTHSRQVLGGQATFSAGYDQGVKLFGAFDDATAPAGSARGQFSRFRLSASYMKPYNFENGVTALYSGYLQGQWSPHALFGSEQMSLGGTSSIRGTRDAILYGKAAVMMRNDFSFLLPASQNPELSKAVGRIEPYIAIDAGYVPPDASGNVASGALLGSAVGVRNRGGHLSFDISYSDIFYMPAAIKAVGAAVTGLVQAKVSVSF